MKMKKISIIVLSINLLLFSNYLVFQYATELAAKRLIASSGSLDIAFLLSLEKNEQPVKYVLATNIYYNIVNASLKRVDEYNDIEYFSFMCEEWDNNLTDIVIKNKNYDQNISYKPPYYELYLEGVENLDDLCSK
jgi:hypothetical protein